MRKREGTQTSLEFPTKTITASNRRTIEICRNLSKANVDNAETRPTHTHTYAAKPKPKITNNTKKNKGILIKMMKLHPLEL